MTKTVECGKANVLVIIATYNECDNVKPLLDQLIHEKIGCDFLIVDDNSPDGTGDVCERLAKGLGSLHILHRKVRTGLRDALVDGFRWGLSRDYELIVNLDGDLSHRPKDLPRILDGATQADLVLGSRYILPTLMTGWPMYRRWLSRLAGAYVRISMGIRCSDPTSGFRCYRREALAEILSKGIKSRGYSVHFEMAYVACQRRMRIIEIPINFFGREYGRSKMSCRILMEAVTLPWRLRFSDSDSC